MSKRRIEKMLEELSDEVLSDIDPETRLRALLIAQEAGKETWIDRLVATCPRESYMSTDRAVTDRFRLARLLAQQAVFELETTRLQYEQLCMQHRYISAIDACCDEQVSDELTRTTECIEEKLALFIELYTVYHGHREFSRSVLDVELESWLALHPQGSSVLEAVSEVITDQETRERAEEWFESLYPDPQVTLDESAAGRCLLLTTEWETATETIP